MSHEDSIIQPLDIHNKELLSQVRPENWTNPEPQSIYNLVVIGAGTAGLISAAGAAGLGAKVALIEKNLMGGDCLNMGCVPSKAIIRSSRVAAEIKEAERFGVKVNGSVDADFKAVMERMRALRAGISHHDSAARFKSLGIDIFIGAAKFVGTDRIEVSGKTLHFKKAIIATGARAVRPKIEGLEEAGYLTNENVFWLTERPKRLAVLGGGPIGCELAQAFRRLGSEVDVIEAGPQFLPREDDDAAAILLASLQKDGVKVWLNTSLKKVIKKDGGKELHLEKDGKWQVLMADEILVGVGRAPNTEGLNLEAAKVRYSRTGVEVNDFLRTSNPRIFAAGDICQNYKFTHTADASARIAIQNSLFRGKKRLSALVVPWCTYTDPEIAHVGLYEKDAKKQNIEVTTFTKQLKEVDRAILDGEDAGFVKIHAKKGTDKILGATIVSKHAGDMISEITLAMVGGLGLGSIAATIHPYPTQAEAIKQVGDMYNRTRLTPFAKKVLKIWLQYFS